MAETLILETKIITDRGKTHDAHTRNAVEIANYLKADLALSQKDYLRLKDRKYKHIIVSYGSFYSPFDTIAQILANNVGSNFYWLTNEYNVRPISSILKYPYSIISNVKVENGVFKKAKKVHLVNLNTLILREKTQNFSKKYGCVYYGTYRPDRMPYFKEYLKGEIILSTSKKNLVKFGTFGIKPKFVPPLRWEPNKESLKLFKYSLYIEDIYTHTNYNYLGNRFYESLYCSAIPLFDVNCLNTLKLSGLKDYEPFLVKNYDDLLLRMQILNKNYESYQKIIQNWYNDAKIQKNQTLKELGNILN